jgi:hypothetical protein
MDVQQSWGPFRSADRCIAGHSDDQLHCADLDKSSGENPGENSGESRIGKGSFVGALRNFFYRPPKELLCANGAAATPPPPDGSAAIRSADAQPAHRTQSRFGGSQSAEGGTIFFEGVDDLAADLQSDRLLSLQRSEPDHEEGPRVVLWMRSGDPTLRTTMIRGVAADKSTNPVGEQIETVDEVEIALQEGFHVSRGNPERPRLSEVAARPLQVWTVWTNPVCG